jgi:hypothetical protein
MMQRFCPDTRIQAGWNFRKGQVYSEHPQFEVIDRVAIEKMLSASREAAGVCRPTVRKLGISSRLGMRLKNGKTC